MSRSRAGILAKKIIHKSSSEPWGTGSGAKNRQWVAAIILAIGLLFSRSDVDIWCPGVAVRVQRVNNLTIFLMKTFLRNA